MAIGQKHATANRRLEVFGFVLRIQGMKDKADRNLDVGELLGQAARIDEWVRSLRDEGK